MNPNMGDDTYECKKCGAVYKQEEAEMVNFECCDEEVTSLENQESVDENAFGEEDLT